MINVEHTAPSQNGSHFNRGGLQLVESRPVVVMGFSAKKHNSAEIRFLVNSLEATGSI